jgi:hypothetical protein
MNFDNLRQNITQKLTISDEEFALFCSKIRVSQFKKKQILLAEGEVCRYASFINRGAIRGYVVNDKFEEKRFCSASKIGGRWIFSATSPDSLRNGRLRRLKIRSFFR